MWLLLGAGGCLLIPIGVLIALQAVHQVRSFFVSEHTCAKMDVSTISSAVESFAIEHDGRHPTTLTELVTPDPTGRTYLKDRRTMPLDPWKNPYEYEPPTAARAFRVFSPGSDGVPGGVGDAADIDNRSLEASPKR